MILPDVGGIDGLDLALERFAENDTLALPVVDALHGRVLGVIKRLEIAIAYLRRMHAPSDAKTPFP